MAVLRGQGTRLIGPNCLGTHSSPGRFSFIPDPPFSDGGVVVVSQSGGLSVDILRLGSAKGVGFRSVTSMGNGADVTSAELVEHAFDDPNSSVIGLYLESLGEARDVLRVLQRRPVEKPVVLLAGGRTADGSRAATSHTGALAGNHRLWPAVAAQAGITLVDTLDEFLDVLLAFDTLELDDSPNDSGIVLFGNGGGASVLAADALGRRGLSTPALPAESIAEIEGLELPPGNGLANPIDTPAGTLAVDGGAVAGKIIEIVLRHSHPAAVITHLNVGIIQRNLAPRYGDVTGEIIRSLAAARDAATHKAQQFLVLKGDGKEDMDEAIVQYAAQARNHGLPVYRDIEAAATAVRAFLNHQDRASSDRREHPEVGEK
ncbi:MAG: acyl-CoA synthetase [Cumulibacter sp.]